MKFKILLTTITLATALGAAAQSDIQMTQYYEMPTAYNPAAAGQTDFIRIHGAGRMQWVGIQRAPRAILLSGDMPFKLVERRLGTGLLMTQQSRGLYSTTTVAAQIGAKLQLLGGEITVGLQPGIIDQQFRGTEVYIPGEDEYHQPTDDAIPTTNLHGTAFDLSIGTWYRRKDWYAGLSITHLTAPAITMGGENGASASEQQTYEFRENRTLYFTAGCNIPVKNTLFEIIPSTLVKTDFTFTTAEIDARVRYNRFLSAGLGYRYNDAVIITLAAELKNFYVGYSFDYATSALRAASYGSHEIMVGYSTKIDLGAKNRHRHKSIRLM